MKRLVPAVAALLAMLPAPVFAASNLTIRFTGDCSDCAGRATATLVLKDFVLNGPNPNLSDANLVSFTYDGTNLIAPYSSDSHSFLSGYLTDPASPDPALAGLAGLIGISVADPGGFERFFSATSHGNWSVTRTVGGAPEDFGGNAVFTVLSGVPDTASWAMFILGFGLIGGTMRRRGTNFRFG